VIEPVTSAGGVLEVKRAESAQPAAVKPMAASKVKRGQLRERDGTAGRGMGVLALTHETWSRTKHRAGKKAFKTTGRLAA
jgi:hypothetical protein